MKTEKKPQKVPKSGNKHKAECQAYRAADKAGANRKKNMARHAKKAAKHIDHLAKRRAQGKPIRGTARAIRRSVEA